MILTKEWIAWMINIIIEIIIMVWIIKIQAIDIQHQFNKINYIQIKYLLKINNSKDKFQEKEIEILIICNTNSNKIIFLIKILILNNNKVI